MADVGTSLTKFLKHAEHITAMQRGAVWPVHMAALCTSRCQLQCPFCVVRDREENRHLDFGLFKWTVGVFASHGMGAIQFSGGDPFAWPWIDDGIRFCHEVGLSIGVQTNGVAAHEHTEALRHVKWLRASVYTDGQMRALRLEELPASLNVSVSTVWHAGIAPEFIQRFRDYAVRIEAKHARVVQDLWDRDSEHARSVEPLVAELGPPLVFVRRPDERPDFCAIAWWKTVLDWDGWLYACGCTGTRGGGSLPKDLRICRAEDAEMFYAQPPRDLGHRCFPCSYRDQNALLKQALTPVDDPEFI